MLFKTGSEIFSSVLRFAYDWVGALEFGLRFAMACPSADYDWLGAFGSSCDGLSPVVVLFKTG